MYDHCGSAPLALGSALISGFLRAKRGSLDIKLFPVELPRRRWYLSISQTQRWSETSTANMQAALNLKRGRSSSDSALAASLAADFAAPLDRPLPAEQM